MGTKEDKMLIFHIGKGGKRFPLNGGHLTCKGQGDIEDILDRCGVDIHIEDGKFYTDTDHFAGYADGNEIDIDGIYDTWYCKSDNRLTDEERRAAVDYGYDEYEFECND